MIDENKGFHRGMIECNKVLAETLESNIRQVKKMVGKFKVMVMTPGTRHKLEAIDRVLFELADDAGVLHERCVLDESEFLLDNSEWGRKDS